VPAPGETRLGAPGQRDQLYRISYDGSIIEETRYIVMGGATEPVASSMEQLFVVGWPLDAALAAAVTSLGAGGDGAPRTLNSTQLEVAVLERTMSDRTFRRLERGMLDALLTGDRALVPTGSDDAPAAESPADASIEDDRPGADT